MEKDCSFKGISLVRGQNCTVGWYGCTVCWGMAPDKLGKFKITTSPYGGLTMR